MYQVVYNHLNINSVRSMDDINLLTSHRTKMFDVTQVTMKSTIVLMLMLLIFSWEDVQLSIKWIWISSVSVTGQIHLRIMVNVSSLLWMFEIIMISSSIDVGWVEYFSSSSTRDTRHTFFFFLHHWTHTDRQLDNHHSLSLTIHQMSQERGRIVYYFLNETVLKCDHGTNFTLRGQ